MYYVYRSASNDSYYLPSADEASEIVDEDDLQPKHSRRHRKPPQQVSAPRAKSADRDSDFSEMTTTTPITESKKKIGKSLESIQDDSGYQDVDFKVLRDKVAYLEEEIEKKDREIVEIKQRSPSSGVVVEHDQRIQEKVR